MATGRWGYLVLGSIAGVAISFVGFQLFAHARVRFLAWQDPFADPTHIQFSVDQPFLTNGKNLAIIITRPLSEHAENFFTCSC